MAKDIFDVHKEGLINRKYSFTSIPDAAETNYRGVCSTAFNGSFGVHKEGFNHRIYSATSHPYEVEKDCRVSVKLY